MTYKNRGMLLEQLINASLIYCAQQQLALLHKKEVPTQIRGRLDQEAEIRAAVRGVSTVDYYGVCRGQFVAFEAKATRQRAWPLSALQPHQRAYLEAVHAHGGQAYLLIGYVTASEFFLIPISALSRLDKRQIKITEASAFGEALDLVFPGRLNLCEVLWRRSGA